MNEFIRVGQTFLSAGEETFESPPVSRPVLAGAGKPALHQNENCCEFTRRSSGRR